MDNRGIVSGACINVLNGEKKLPVQRNKESSILMCEKCFEKNKTKKTLK